MTKLKNNVEKLNVFLKEGKIREAFQEFYNTDVTIHVDGNAPITGKEQKREIIFLQEIEKLNNAEVKLVVFGGANDDISVTEWEMNIENKEGEKKIIYRVNVQRWKDDKIIDEKIYFCGDQKFKVDI